MRCLGLLSELRKYEFFGFKRGELNEYFTKTLASYLQKIDDSIVLTVLHLFLQARDVDGFPAE